MVHYQGNSILTLRCYSYFLTTNFREGSIAWGSFGLSPGLGNSIVARRQKYAAGLTPLRGIKGQIRRLERSCHVNFHRCSLCGFLGCSRSGHHPEPIAPEIERSPYDIRALGLRATNGVPPLTVHSEPQRQLKAGEPIHISYRVDNVGTATIPGYKFYISLFLGKKYLGAVGDRSEPLKPGKRKSGGVRPEFNPDLLVLKEAKRYEIRLVTGLLRDLGETNLDNNVLILNVDVKE